MEKIEDLKKEIARLHGNAFVQMGFSLSGHTTTAEAVQSMYDHFTKHCGTGNSSPLEILKEMFGNYKKACESAFEEIETAIAGIEGKEAAKYGKNT